MSWLMTRCSKCGISLHGISLVGHGLKFKRDLLNSKLSGLGTIRGCRSGSFRPQPKFRLQIHNGLTNQTRQSLPLRTSFWRS